MLDQILAETFAKTVQANSRGAIGNSQLAGDLPQGQMAADSNQHRHLVGRQRRHASLGDSHKQSARFGRFCLERLCRAQPVGRMAFSHDPLAPCARVAVCAFTNRRAAMQIAVPVARAVSDCGDQVSRQMTGRDLIFHQMEDDVVEQGRHQLVALTRIDTHPTGLVSEQWSIEEEQLTNGFLLPAMDGGQQSRRRRITRGGKLFTLTPRNVVALLHWIPASSVVVASIPDGCTPGRYSSCRRIQFRSELSIFLTRDADSPGCWTRCRRISARRAGKPFFCAFDRRWSRSSAMLASECRLTLSVRLDSRSDKLRRTRATFSISSRLGRLGLATNPRSASARPTADVS